MVLGLGFGALCSADDWTRQFSVSGRPTVVVEADDARVEFESGPAGSVNARVDTVGWRIDPSEVTIVESQSGSRVRLEVKLPRSAWRGWGEHHGRRSITVTLRVPKESDLDVHTGDGSVNVPEIAGRVSVVTGDGSIAILGARGEIHLQTGDGSIDASGLDGNLRAQTGDGRVKVRGRFEALEVRTGDGGIDAEVEPGSKLLTEWSLDTGDGGIRLTVPGDLGAELFARSGDGTISMDIPLTVQGTIGRTQVRGTLGAGGLPLRLHTGDGSIRVAARGNASASAAR
jgi:DUF4097 and DUF4098 domain-containing protein YvlB